MLMRGVRQDVRQRKPQRGRIPVPVSVRKTASILQRKCLTKLLVVPTWAKYDDAMRYQVC